MPAEPQTEPSTDGATPFVPYEPEIVGSRDELDALSHDRQVQRLVAQLSTEITQFEGPIEIGRLANAVVRSFGFTRVRQNREREVLGYLPKNLVTRQSSLGVFAWPSNIDPDTWRGYRVTQDGTDRSIGEIAPEEITNAIHHALASERQTGRDSLFRTTLELLGYHKLTQQAREVLGAALEFGVQRGRVLTGGRE